ncbi:MAG: adenylate/guanylate cyclase domain-containing protein, partial [Pseudomonadota bacterium]
MKRKLTVILAADLVGYSRLVSADEEQCIQRLKHVWDEIFDVEIKSTDGRVIKRMGDGLLAEFQSPVSAVRCAIKIQESLSTLVSNLKEDKMEFRIGINLGDVVEDGEDLLGDGVNVASRLEAIAQPGGIYVSKSVHDHLGGKIAADLIYLGPHQLKNIPDPVDVWQVKSSSEIVVPGKSVKAETNPSLAILPFEEIGPAHEDFFADGIVEEITGALSRVREFSVIARQSSYSINRENADVREVGRILGAGYIVTGSVRRSGDRVRISVQLSNTQDGTQIWTERFDDHLDDVFELQDRIANSVAGAISPTVRASEIASAKSKSPDD